MPLEPTMVLIRNLITALDIIRETRELQKKVDNNLKAVIYDNFLGLKPFEVWSRLNNEILYIIVPLPRNETWAAVVKNTAQKMTFSIKDFFSKWDQIIQKLRLWSHLLKKSLMENFIICAVNYANLNHIKGLVFFLEYIYLYWSLVWLTNFDFYFHFFFL